MKPTKFNQLCNTKKKICYKHHKSTNSFTCFTVSKKEFIQIFLQKQNIIYLLDCTYYQKQYDAKSE